MTSLLAEMFGNTRRFLERLGALAWFSLQVLRQTPVALLRPRLVVEQVYHSGAQSLVIIMTCGLFIGMVMLRVAMLANFFIQCSALMITLMVCATCSTL